MANIYHTHCESLALRLWDEKIIQVDMENRFELTDGSYSPIYFDIRKASNNLCDEIGRILFEATLSDDIIYDGIAGIPNAATSLAESFAKTDNQTKTVKLTKKDGGDFVVVNMGWCVKGNIILLIDDVATTAKTKFGAIKALFAEGFLTANVLVVCDRQQGAEEELAKVNCELLSLLTIYQLLDFGMANGFMNNKKFRYVLKYLRQRR